MATQSPTILLTGASRGLGNSIAHILLNHPSKPNLVLTSRTAGPLTSFEAQYPSRVAYLAGDITSPRIEADLIKLAVFKFGSLDGLIINHGILGPVRRIGDLHQNQAANEEDDGARSEDDVKYWEDSKNCWDVNYFSALRLSAEALPWLKKSQHGGKIVFVSSGASMAGYSGWEVYGSTKAALNHLCFSLASEEPQITAVAVRPGVVDTDMQVEIREQHRAAMGEEGYSRFAELHKTGKLLKPEQPGAVIANLAIGAPKTLSGKFISWNEEELASFQKAS